MNTNSPEPKKNKSEIDDAEIFPACSSGDCTGLIPRGIEDESELESYKDLYNFTNPNKTQI